MESLEVPVHWYRLIHIIQWHMYDVTHVSWHEHMKTCHAKLAHAKHGIRLEQTCDKVDAQLSQCAQNYCPNVLKTLMSLQVWTTIIDTPKIAPTFESVQYLLKIKQAFPLLVDV